MVTEVRLNWPPRDDGKRGPSDRQAEFLRCGAKEQLYGGSKRGGKTVAGCAKAIYLSYLFPGNRGFIFRQAFTDLRDSTLVTFFSLCPPELIIGHNKQDHRLTIRSRDPKHPSTIVYRGLGEDAQGGVSAQKAKEKAKAIETGWFWVDEPSEVAFDAYTMMLSQLCWFLPDGSRPPYMALLTSNPEPGWVKDRFVDDTHKDYIIGKADAKFIPSLPRDNPGLPPGWELDLRATMDGEWVRRYLDGSWDIHEGQVFGELDDKIHNLDNYFDTTNDEMWKNFHKGFRKVGCLDHASTGITAYVMTGIDADENCFGLQEYFEQNKRISEHAKGIEDLEGWYGKPEYRLIDPNTESDTLQNGQLMYSVQSAYCDSSYGHVKPGHEIVTIAAHRMHIAVGIDIIKEYLHVNPLHRNPFTNELGSPSLFISKRRNPNGWREMVGLKKRLRPDGTIEFVGEDHWIDDLRYILTSRPRAAERKKLDVTKLPIHAQIQHKAQDKFFEKWGRDMNEGSWF